MDDIVERLRENRQLQLCPFDRLAPPNKLLPNDPCPVCGMLGTDDAEDTCKGANTSLFAKAADEIERLRGVIDCGCNAITDAINLGGPDIERIRAIKNRMFRDMSLVDDDCK